MMIAELINLKDIRLIVPKSMEKRYLGCVENVADMRSLKEEPGITSEMMKGLSHSGSWLTALFVVAELSQAIEVRMDCHPERGASLEKCRERDCIWTPTDQLPGTPFEYMSINLPGRVRHVITLKKKKGTKNPWGDDIEEIQLKSDYIGKTLNVKIFAEGRYDPPVDLPRNPSESADNLELITESSNDSFHFVVTRNSTGAHLFDTSIGLKKLLSRLWAIYTGGDLQKSLSGGLMFSDKFLQIATYLPSDAMYGWGENAHPTLKHDFSIYRTWGMWARDEPPHSTEVDTKNLYGVHPFYMVLEPDGKAHGVLILNSNAQVVFEQYRETDYHSYLNHIQQVTTAPGPAIIYRTIGGNLDLYFFPGPTPEEVTQQYLSLIGKPILPAYWALGFQLSRYGYKDLDDMKTTIERNMKAGIPLETVVVDIDFMDRYKMFTVGKTFEGLAEYLKEVQSWGMRAILLYDPGIQVDDEPFKRALQNGETFTKHRLRVLAMNSLQDLYPLVKNTKIMLGVVWPDRHVAFPDFLDPTNATKNWWIQEIVNFHKKVPHDGIWIDMNEPSAFGTNEKVPWYFQMKDHPNIEALWCPTNSTDRQWEVPPFQTHSVYHYKYETLLASKTLCMTALQADGKQRFYNVKNLYGWSEARITQQAHYAAMGKRCIVVSRSTFPSAGRYTGHWLGDNSATWEDLQASIIGAMEFNMFGIPFVGADLCGFNGKTSEELCLRWQQLGAFHPFMRNHNAINEPPQDPALWPSVAEATKKATLFRYRYLPYLFSLHFIASMEGATVIRPVFYEYPNDNNTHNLSHQFLWGRSMLIAPALHENANSVDVYLPKDDWYSLFDFQYGEACESGTRKYPAPLTSLIPVFVR
ncbi:glycosyl hydrolase, family 31, partial [Ostertagia ostertagi]